MLRVFIIVFINCNIFSYCKLFIGWSVTPVKIRNLQFWVYFKNSHFLAKNRICVKLNVFVKYKKKCLKHSFFCHEITSGNMFCMYNEFGGTFCDFYLLSDFVSECHTVTFLLNMSYSEKYPFLSRKAFICYLITYHDSFTII